MQSRWKLEVRDVRRFETINEKSKSGTEVSCHLASDMLFTTPRRRHLSELSLERIEGGADIVEDTSKNLSKVATRRLLRLFHTSSDLIRESERVLDTLDSDEFTEEVEVVGGEDLPSLIEFLESFESSVESDENELATLHDEVSAFKEVSSTESRTNRSSSAESVEPKRDSVVSSFRLLLSDVRYHGIAESLQQLVERGTMSVHRAGEKMD